MKVTVGEPHLLDIADVALRMKYTDREEVRASCGMNPRDTLVESVRISEWCRAIRIDNRAEAIYGVSRLSPNIGGAWMLSTTSIYQYPKLAWKTFKRVLEEMHSLYPMLTNFIDARNDITIRWLERLGWTYVRTVDQYGVAKIPFKQYVSYRHV